MSLQNQIVPTDAAWQIGSKVVTSLLTALVLFLLSLLSKTIRHALLYKRHEFEFEYDSDFRGCEYDVQWEELRLTFQIGDVHNDHLENVIIKRNEVNPGKKYEKVEVSNNFNEISEWNLHFKLVSIIRTKPQTGLKEYQIYVVIRRRRW
ncbi:MAG TPA: hypothetical protein VN937_07620 [Blastocatellia bacterium]|nr:hypothetical protein [Blastocatellia bacterium]